MADYIDREELLKKVNDVIENGLGEQISFSADGLKFLIDCLPSVDAVEVVRCENCKYRSNHKPYFCMKFSEIDTKEYHFYTSEDIISFPLYVDNTDYCKWGEKE